MLFNARALLSTEKISYSLSYLSWDLKLSNHVTQLLPTLELYDTLETLIGFAFEQGSFWWENLIAVVILLGVLARILERWKQVIKCLKSYHFAIGRGLNLLQ